MKRLRAIRYRLYPTAHQEKSLNRTLDLCRNLYNAALEQRKFAYRYRGKSLSFYDQTAELKNLRKEFREYEILNFQVAKAVLDQLDKAYQNFFRRVKRGEKPGFPRFRGAGRFDSFTFPAINANGTVNGLKFIVSSERRWGRIQLSDVLKTDAVKRSDSSMSVKCLFHEPLSGRVKRVTIKREVDQWFCIVLCEQEVGELGPNDRAVGIDLGVSPNFAILSTGEKIENPKFYINEQRKLRRIQRSFSRKRRNSKRRAKQKILLARKHRKIRRQRDDFHHKLSRRLVNEYGIIVHEALNVRNMSKSFLAKHILDAGWYSFFQKLSYKAEWAGRKVIAVDPRYSSQECHECGHVNPQNRPKGSDMSRFRCQQCGHETDADVNAAKVILSRGLVQVGPSGANHGAVKAGLPEKPAAVGVMG